MKLTRFSAFVASLALMGMLVGCGGGEKKAAAPSTQKVYNVGIVQLVEHGALDAANKGFVDGLAAKGFKEGANVKIDRQNAQADQSNLQTIAQRFVNNKVDIICAIATPAAQVVANATKTIPIVGTAITDYEAAKLVKANGKPETNVTGTSDMNPVAEQINLLLQLAPKAKTIGIIYTSSEINSQIQVDIAKKAAAAKGVKVEVATISTVNDIQQAAQSLAGKVQAMYVPTDNVVASSMPTLAKITDEHKLPVVGGEEGQVKDGATATLGINYYKLGKQTGEMAAEILAGKAKPQTMAIQTQKDFEYVVNRAQLKKLGITLPANIEKVAKDVKVK